MSKLEEDSIKITVNDLPQIFNVKYLGKCEAKGLWGIKHTRTPVDIMVSFAKDRQLVLPIMQLKICKEGISMIPLKTSLRLEHDTNTNQIEKPKLNSNEKPKKHTPKQKEFLFNIQQTLFKNKKITKDKNDNIEESKNEMIKNKENILEPKKKQPVGPGLIKPIHSEQIFFGVDTISYGVQDLVYTRVFSMIVVSDPDSRTSSPFTVHAFVCDSRSTARKLTYSLAAAFLIYSQSVKAIKQKLAIPPGPWFKEMKPRRAAIDLRTPEQLSNDMKSLHFLDSEA